MRVLATVLIVAAVALVIYFAAMSNAPENEDTGPTADSRVNRPSAASGNDEEAVTSAEPRTATEPANAVPTTEADAIVPSEARQREAQQRDPRSRPDAREAVREAPSLNAHAPVQERRLVAARSPTEEPPPMDPLLDRREAIRDAVGEVREGMRECYELILAVEPGLSDRLVFEMSVTADPDDPERGVAELVGIESNTLIIEDVACFAGVLDELVLPPPIGDEDSYTLRYPVVLNTD